LLFIRQKIFMFSEFFSAFLNMAAFTPAAQAVPAAVPNPPLIAASAQQLRRSLPSMAQLNQSIEWQRLCEHAAQYPTTDQAIFTTLNFIAYLLDQSDPQAVRTMLISNQKTHSLPLVLVSPLDENALVLVPKGKSRRAGVSLSLRSLERTPYFSEKLQRLQAERRPDDGSSLRAISVEEVDTQTLIATGFLLDFLDTQLQQGGVSEDEIVRQAGIHLEKAYRSLIVNGRVNPRPLFDSCHAFARMLDWQLLTASFDVFALSYLEEEDF
jgi:hypothetical protein